MSVRERSLHATEAMFGFASKKVAVAVAVEDPPSYPSILRELVAPLKDVYLPSAAAHAKAYLASVAEYKVLVLVSFQCLLIALLLCLHKRTPSSDNGEGKEGRAAKTMASEDATEHTLEPTLVVSSSSSDGSVSTVGSAAGDRPSATFANEVAEDVAEFEENVTSSTQNTVAAAEMEMPEIVDKVPARAEKREMPSAQNTAAVERKAPEDPAIQDAAPEDQPIQDVAPADQPIQDATALDIPSSSFDEVLDTSNTSLVTFEDKVSEDAPAPEDVHGEDTVVMEVNVPEDPPPVQDAAALDTSNTSQQEEHGTAAPEKPASSPPTSESAVASSPIPRRASVKQQLSARMKRPSIKRNLSKIFK